jgi:hypothetical protein
MCMTDCDSCGGPPVDASKDQTEGGPQLDSLLDGADAARRRGGRCGVITEAGVETGAAEAAGTETAPTDQMDAMSQLELLLGRL